MEPHVRMHQVLMGLLEELVDQPEKMTVKATVTDFETVFDVTPPPGEGGMLVGKMGRTARALRTILSCAARKHGTRYTLNIDESGFQRPEPACVQCGCTQDNACQLQNGSTCAWVPYFAPRRVCSKYECVVAEMTRVGAVARPATGKAMLTHIAAGSAIGLTYVLNWREGAEL